jgi:hypothetical protein
MSAHWAGDTLLPNHWWAISWATVASSGMSGYIGRVWLSSA